jgi:hypothetical protein
MPDDEHGPGVDVRVPFAELLGQDQRRESPSSNERSSDPRQPRPWAPVPGKTGIGPALLTPRKAFGVCRREATVPDSSEVFAASEVVAEARIRHGDLAGDGPVPLRDRDPAAAAGPLRRLVIDVFSAVWAS